MEKEEYRNPGEVRFHYNREERLKGLSEEIRERKPAKIFKGNRGLIILLIDILIILILYLILNPLLRGAGDSRSEMGYHFQLSGFIFENECMASVKIRLEEPDKMVSHQLVNVIFAVKELDVREETADLLPGGNGDSRILRATFPLSGDETRETYTLEAKVILGEKEFLLSEEVEGEH